MEQNITENPITEKPVIQRSDRYTFNAVFITYFLIILSLALLRVIIYFGAFDWAGDQGIDYIFTLIAQVFILAAGPIILLTCVLKKGFKGTMQFLQVKKPKPYIFLAFALGFFGYFGNMIVNIIFSGILVGLGWHSSSGGAAMTSYPVWLLLINIVFTAVLPGICEEITHRGLVLQGSKKGGASDAKAIIISGICFGLFHMYIGQTFFTAIMGAMMALLVIKSKSIIPAIIMHFTNNFIAVWTEFSDVNGIPGIFSVYDAADAGNMVPFVLFLLFCVLSIGAFIGLIFLFIAKARKAGDCPPKKAKVYAPAYYGNPYMYNAGGQIYYGQQPNYNQPQYYGQQQQPQYFVPNAQAQQNPQTPYQPQSQNQNPFESPLNPFNRGSQTQDNTAYNYNSYVPFDNNRFQPQQQSGNPYMNPYQGQQQQGYNPYQPQPPQGYNPYMAAQYNQPMPPPVTAEPEDPNKFKPRARDKIFFYGTIILAGLITIISFISGL